MPDRLRTLPLLACLLSGAAWAGSGAIEINQAPVEAAGGFPFVISA